MPVVVAAPDEPTWPVAAARAGAAALPAGLRPVVTLNGDLRRIHPRLPDPFALTPPDLGLPDVPPWRCVGGAINAVQRAGFARVAFISEPPPRGGVRF